MVNQKMPDFELRYLHENEYPMWDEFVEKSTEGTIFHKTFWLKALGLNFVIYGYFKGAELFAGIPLVCNTRLGIKQGLHPPLTPYLGLVFRDYNSKYVNKLSNEVKISREIARRLKKDFHIVQFKFAPGSVDLQPFIWEGFSVAVRYTYVLNLEGDLQDIYSHMEDRRKNIIRKAERDGVTIVRSDDFDQSFRLIEKTYSRQKRSMDLRKIDAFRYNQALKERNQCQLFLAADKGGHPLSAVYIIWDGKRSYYILGGFDSEATHEGATPLAIWKAIEFTKTTLGLKEFDFEGSMVPRLEVFFRFFGGILTPYYTTTWTNQYLRIFLPIYHRALKAMSHF